MKSMLAIAFIASLFANPVFASADAGPAEIFKISVGGSCSDTIGSCDSELETMRIHNRLEAAGHCAAPLKANQVGDFQVKWGLIHGGYAYIRDVQVSAEYECVL